MTPGGVRGVRLHRRVEVDEEERERVRHRVAGQNRSGSQTTNGLMACANGASTVVQHSTNYVKTEGSDPAAASLNCALRIGMSVS